MKTIHWAIAAAALTMAACQPSSPRLDSHTDTLSWALGQNTAETILSAPQGIINQEIFMQAVEHTLAQKPAALTDEQYQRALQDFLIAAQTPSAPANAAPSQNIDQLQQQYFAQLQQEHPTVQYHPSGFYYEQLKAGKGPKAQYAQRILFDYRGYLMLNGQLFDQTYGNREPIMHVIGSPMFTGLIEGLQLMNTGSIYRFYFPYQLAFGAEGSGGGVPPYTPIIYEVELHQIFDN